MGGLAPGADGVGSHKLLGIVVEGGPPESAADEFCCPPFPWVTGNVTGVTPLQHLWADGGGDEQPVPWSIARTGLGLLGLSYYRVNSPGDNTHHSGGGKDGVQHLWDLREFPSELTGEGISPDVLGARAVGEGEIEPAEE